LAKWEANYENHIFWGPWPMVLWRLHSTTLVLDNDY